MHAYGRAFGRSEEGSRVGAVMASGMRHSAEDVQTATCVATAESENSFVSPDTGNLPSRIAIVYSRFPSVMKYYLYLFLVLLAAVGWPLGSDGARAATSAELLQSCQAVVSTAGPVAEQTIDIPTEGLPCWYYIEAIQNMSVLVDQAGQPLLGVCAPPDSTVMDYVHIFVRSARENVGGEGNAAALAVQGLARAFPCHQSTGH
jgi:hypothetical protein